MKSDAIDLINHWLITEGVKAPNVPTLIVGLSQKLNDIGFKIIRSGVMARTLHPEIESIRFTWMRSDVEMPPFNPTRYHQIRQTQVQNEIVEEISFSHGAFERSAPYQVSPFKELDLGAPEINEKIHPGTNRFVILDELRETGGTGYYLLALPKLSSFSHRISWATAKPGGFSADDILLFRGITNHLATAMEIQVNRYITANLLAVYLGAQPAAKVQAGQIKPGDIEEISSAIWFSDLRGFTELSQSVDSATIVAWLNDYFETISKPIIENGGEILKYIGDAVLAVFPVIIKEKEAALAAFNAATSANSALNLLNQKRSRQKLPELLHGISLHLGKIQYGNIGANQRLDFTVIGQAVNLASRMEGLCKVTGEKLLFSEEIAAYLENLRLVGEFELKGIHNRQKVFALTNMESN